MNNSNKNNSSNTELANRISNVVSKSANPYAKAAGKTAKVADKLTGGKASEKLGNAIGKTHGGKIARRVLNNKSNDGTASRISNALGKKNSMAAGLSGIFSGKQNKETDASSTFGDSTLKETEEQMSDGGGSNFKVDFKIVRYGLIVCAAVFPLIIFVALLTTASQVYLKAVGLGHADSTSNSDAESKINKASKKADKNFSSDIEDAFNFYIDDEKTIEFRNSKLNSMNLEPVALFRRRKNIEVTFDDLEDFYPNVGILAEEYDRNSVYNFFLKMYYLYHSYENKYDKLPEDNSPLIDLPLLMATLMLETDNMNALFASNLGDNGTDVENYLYEWDSTSYKLYADKSPHDMELLVQHMVSRRLKEVCRDSNGQETKSNILVDSQIGNETLECGEDETYTSTEYYMFDDNKYREFLKEFIEKKYYINDGLTVSLNNYTGKIDNTDSRHNDYNGSSNTKNPYANAVINLLNEEYKSSKGITGGMKYKNAYGYGQNNTPWCGIFVWYIITNAKVDGISLYENTVPYKSAVAAVYAQNFKNSTKTNIKFYYNDNVSRYAGKNTNVAGYIPKPGDLIFFDFGQGNAVNSETLYGIDHVGFVEYYDEKTNIVHTIEGNTSAGIFYPYGTVAKKSRRLNACTKQYCIVGFGSWY